MKLEMVKNLDSLTWWRSIVPWKWYSHSFCEVVIDHVQSCSRSASRTINSTNTENHEKIGIQFLPMNHLPVIGNVNRNVPTVALSKRHTKRRDHVAVVMQTSKKTDQCKTGIFFFLFLYYFSSQLFYRSVGILQILNSVDRWFDDSAAQINATQQQ